MNLCDCAGLLGEVKRDVEPVWNRLVTGPATGRVAEGVEKACAQNSKWSRPTEVVFWSTQEVPHEVLSSFKAV